LAKEGLTIGWPDLEDIDLSEYENELLIEDVIEIRDLSRLERSRDFALYKRDRILFVDNSDFSEMEVRL
jgi:hypothetical protein